MNFNILKNLTVTKDYLIIRIPRVLIGKNERVKTQKTSEELVDDLSKLCGVLKDVPEFKGKTSVEVQHMIKDLW